MGLYKICEHGGRARDRCEHAWWGSFRGRRVSLPKWANREIRSKVQAQAALDELRTAIRDGTFDPEGLRIPETHSADMKFREFADLYAERYARAKGLGSLRTIEYRLNPLNEWFGERLLREITTADVEDFLTQLKRPAILTRGHRLARSRRPATINRYLSLLRHMFNWAVEREYLDRSPFRRGSVALIRQEREDNRRHRRVSSDEERSLLDVAPSHLRSMIVTALDAGLRRGEMLALTWADVDARPGWLRLRGETTKSGKTRWVPVSTTRLKAALDFLRLDAAGKEKSAAAPVFSNEAGEQIRHFRTAWEMTVLRAHGVEPEWQKSVRALTPDRQEAFRRIGLRWHDLRHEYASRLVERGVALSQVRDLLGHASITTTERYDNQKPEALMAAAKLLESGESFKNLSRSDAQSIDTTSERPSPDDANALEDQEESGGVSDGFRTRDLRSHSPALYP